MPVLVPEKEKKDVDGKKDNFDVKSIIIETVSKAIIEAINAERATAIKKVLDFCIHSSRLDGGEYKLNFAVIQKKDFFKNNTNKLFIEGDLPACFNYLKNNFISAATQAKLVEELNKFKIQQDFPVDEAKEIPVSQRKIGP